MYFKIIKNDIGKSKLISITIMLFVSAAAMLVSLAAILLVNLTGAVKTLVTQAKTPHFVQMHAGALDTAQIAEFAKENDKVEQYQIARFLGIDGADLVFNGVPFTGSMSDHGFTTQNKNFDFLLDMDGTPIVVEDGELYIPVLYWKEGTLKVGDSLQIHDKAFTVAGFLRDSQMNSPLASSRRYLISENDYSEIQGFGSLEYLIEFRLKNSSLLGAFEADYITAGLPANGPTVTLPLFQVMNGFSDGIMIAIVFIMSILVVVIAFLCIRFTLLARMEDDYKQIGVMKAIGMRVSDIKKLYSVKYAALSAVGCALGLGLSFLLREELTENIRMFMGESKNASSASLFGLVGVCLVFLIIIAYVSGVLRRFKKVSAMNALRFGAAPEKKGAGKRLLLSQNRLLNTNVFLGIKDVFERKRLYITMLVVLVVACFIILVPQNLSNTISGDHFSAYMGVGSYDIRLDIQQMEDIGAKAAEVVAAMAEDADVSKYSVLTTQMFRVMMEDGTEERIRVEVGDHSVFPINCSSGRMPAAENEIALSSLNADALGKQVGDTVTLITENGTRSFAVSGIYSDLTNGGKTAKALFAEESEGVMWSIVSISLKDSSQTTEKVAQYTATFSYAKVSSVDKFMVEIFGSTIRAVQNASSVGLVVALAIVVLTTLLFMNMLIAKDRHSIATMKSFGFTEWDVSLQYISRSVFILVIGIVLGTLLANTLGEGLAGLAIASFGISSFAFEINPISAYLLCPITVILATMLGTVLGASGIGRVKLSENIKE